MYLRLFYIKEKALEVLSFWMVDVDRVVTWLVETVKDPDLAATLGCCGEYRKRKCFLIYNLRTTVCEYESAWSYLGNRSCVESLVSSEGILQRATMLCECWRIDNHEIVFAFRC